MGCLTLILLDSGNFDFKDILTLFMNHLHPDSFSVNLFPIFHFFIKIIFLETNYFSFTLYDA